MRNLIFKIRKRLGLVKVTVFLKSGHKVTFRCKDVKFDYVGGTVTGYHIIGANVYLSCERIEAVIID